MKRWVRGASALVLGTALLAATALADAKPLKLDTTHSKVGFTASTLLFDVDGHFGKYDVKVDGDPSKPESAKLSVSIDVSSIDTDNGKRDSHLKAPDFFDAKKFPKITFTSSKITRKGNKLSVSGTLTMHGKSRKVTLPMKIATGKNGAGKATTAYKGKLTINRNDFGVGQDSIAAKISLEDEVEISLLIVAFI